MPYLKLYAPEFSFEQKKIAASELTEAVLQTLGSDEAARDDIIIRFIPYRMDNLATGGRLASETEEPEYRLEVHCHLLPRNRKNALAQQLLSVMTELFGLQHSVIHRISILFQEHPMGDAVTHKGMAAGKAKITETDLTREASKAGV